MAATPLSITPTTTPTTTPIQSPKKQAPKYTIREIHTEADVIRVLEVICPVFSTEESNSILGGTTPADEFAYYKPLCQSIEATYKRTGYTFSAIVEDEEGNALGGIIACAESDSKFGPKSPAIKRAHGIIDTLHERYAHHLATKNTSKRTWIYTVGFSPKARGLLRTTGFELINLTRDNSIKAGMHALCGEASSARSAWLFCYYPLLFIRGRIHNKEYHNGYSIGPAQAQGRLGFLKKNQIPALNCEISLMECILPASPVWNAMKEYQNMPTMKVPAVAFELEQQLKRERGDDLAAGYNQSNGFCPFLPVAYSVGGKL
jgi:hypothetical protein